MNILHTLDKTVPIRDILPIYIQLEFFFAKTQWRIQHFYAKFRGVFELLKQSFFSPKSTIRIKIESVALEIKLKPGIVEL